MRASNAITYSYQLLTNIGRTHGSGGRAHGFRWSEARFLWEGVQCDRSNVFKLYFDYGIRTETFLEKKLIMWSCRKKNFFQIFENYIFCEIFTPPLGLPTRSVIFYHMTLILFAIHSFDLGQCLISYFMLISHTENFLDTLKVWSKRDFCKFAPPPRG